MAEKEPDLAYVFAYGSLVAMREPLQAPGGEIVPMSGRLRGYQRVWGVAMNNWEAAPDEKHYVDPETRVPPRIRVAFLDVDERPDGLVNGLAVPVDLARLAAMDVREVNYSRIEVSSLFEPILPSPVFTYQGTMAARERSRVPPSEPEVCVSEDYLGGVRRAFGSLGADSLAEFDLTTGPCPFALRHLDLVRPDQASERSSGPG